ncbi:hypothetical protein BH11MYX3_BH11MYX3_22560 [soil metagenome]
MRRFVPLLVLFAMARVADAAPCDQLPNPIYLQVGDTQLNLMKRLGRALRDNASKPITLVFVTSGSCTNIQAIYTRVPITGNMQYVPSLTENAAWNPSSPTLTCTAPGAGVVPDIANSALLNSACTTETPPATVHLQQGPVQAYVMAVPVASSQIAITYEEAYFVFGFGAAGMIAPWIDEAQLSIRTVTKSTLLAWGANISVPADKWKGVRNDGSPAVVAALQQSTSPEKAIGILGIEVADALRGSLRVLAFRAKGQRAAYYPDSTSTARDKQNVRDGHYTVWSPTIWMDTVDGSGTPVKPDARYVVDLITGKPASPAPSFAAIDSIAAVGLVPDCAMGVTRSFEGGPLSIYKPAQSCVCRFENLVQSTSCQMCSPTQACTSGTCRDGFCEVQ